MDNTAVAYNTMVQKLNFMKIGHLMSIGFTLVTNKGKFRWGHSGICSSGI